MGINKLTRSYLTAAVQPNVKIEDSIDNYLVRVKIPEIVDALMEWKDHSGNLILPNVFFFFWKLYPILG